MYHVKLVMPLQAISPGEVATEFVPRMRGIKNPTNEMIQQIYNSSFAHVVSHIVCEHGHNHCMHYHEPR